MKLDERIVKLSDVLTCVDVEEAKQFLNQTGYFADVIYAFENLSNKAYSSLDFLDNVECFDSAFHAQNGSCRWRYFLPECRLKPKEKNFRPYTLMEFSEKFMVGQPIKFRRKGMEGCERYLILNGYQHEQYDGKTFTYIYIGQGTYSLQELFKEYEWQVHYTEDFQPFGVEE